ncbi:MAG: DUF4382 domain-containing protein [Capsulimonadales bacterium]|nr:DUF4382 domain-containing protein [Capsulimonadales bacterium]
MRRLRYFLPFLPARATTAFGVLGAAGALALSGCSGSSSGNAASATGGRATILLTDSFREDFAHVWATLYHVELTPEAGGAAVVVFDDPNGVTIDLKTLRDASGERYVFLGSSSVPSGVYSGVNVTVGPTFRLFRNGTAVGDPLAVDDSVPKDASGRPVLSVTFSSPKTLGTGTTNLIIDFDLARFILRGSKVLPALKEGSAAGLTLADRHNKNDYRGTVRDLTGTAPDLTFTLTRRDGTTVTVRTSAATALYGSTLANNAVVEVRGTLDTTSQTLVATEIEVRDTAIDLRKPRLFGTASDLEATAGTFTLTPATSLCMVPTETTVRVVTTGDTLFRGDTGATLTRTEFFAALASTPNALVEGTYDSATNTLTAIRVKVTDTTQDGGWIRERNGFRRGGKRGDWGNGAL